MSSMPTLGYWDLRGRGEPIRFLLNYAGVTFNDKRYKIGKGTSLAEAESVAKEWIPDKKTMDLEFPNLPYYIDDDIKLTQSLAILRHLGRKYGLWADGDERSLAKQDMAEQQINDFRNTHLLGLFYNPKFETIKDDVISKDITEQLKLISKFLGNNQWLIGDKLVYVDFLAYDTIDWIRIYKTDILDQFPNLIDFMERFENIPQISSYIESGKFKRFPIFGPFAQWGQFIYEEHK